MKRLERKIRSVDYGAATRWHEHDYDYSKKNALTMRDAAMDIAVSKVVEAVYTRGLLP